MNETLLGVRERERTEKRTARTAGVNDLTALRRSVSLEFFPTVIKGQKVIKSFFLKSDIYFLKPNLCRELAPCSLRYFEITQWY